MITIILNDAAYGTERSYNGLRLALSLAKNNENVQVFLMGDGVLCALKNQKTPDGYYNIERMMKGLLRRGLPVCT
ncbi:MAG: DsrE/DsrF/TusD sulfur relay family protein [bacterium]